MRHLSLLLALLVLLTSCEPVSPFIGEDLKIAECDRDDDGLPRADDCEGDDCNDDDAAVGQPLDWFRDDDGDTYGAGEAVHACTQPNGYVDNDEDCDDSDDLVNPDGTEVCDDGIDQDCDDIVDDANGSQTWYADIDEDGYGDPDNTLSTCMENPEGYVDNNQDCDDDNIDVSPSATEVCNDINDDCDSTVDESDDNPDVQTLWDDDDDDGFGDEDAGSFTACPADGFVEHGGDCDDTDSTVNPSASELCDSIDNDCDGGTDEDAEDASTWYIDTDSDGYGDEDDSMSDCATPTGYVEDDTDCDDSDSTVNPDAEEICNNGIDDDCDESPGTCVMPTGTQSVTTADITISDVSSSDAAGWSIAGAGDVNGDGVNDLAIGAPYDDDGGTDAGAVYVFFGPVSSGAISVADANLKLTGETAGDYAGYSLAGAGDVNDDGVDDMAIGAPYDDEGGTDAGAVYVFFGPVSSGAISVADADVKLTGEAASSQAGYSLAGAGDVNGDGVDDLAVGAVGNDDGGNNAGAIYVLYGPITTGEASLSAASLKLTGEAANDQAGYHLTRAGDVNDDGFDDLAIGAPDNDGGGIDTGAVYILYGPLTTGEVSLSSASLKLTGEGTGDPAGTSLSSAGDLNGDGVDDLAVGVVGDEDGGNNAGAVYVLYGPLTTGEASLSTASLKLIGEAAGDQAGTSLSSAGDLNGDGFDDLAIGARYEATAFYQAGAVYVFLGGGVTTGEASLSTADLKLTGAGSGHYLGHAVSLVDVNDDGLEDVVLGTIQQDTYVLLGLDY